MNNIISVVGDAGCGKTSIVQALLTEEFKEYERAQTNKVKVEGKKINRDTDWQILDTGTKDNELDEHALNWCRDGSVFIVVVDLTSKDGLSNVQGWYDRVVKAKGAGLVVVCGAKMDSPDRQLSKETIDEALKKMPEAKYFEVSAKTGEGIQALFEGAVARYEEVSKEEEQAPQEKKPEKAEEGGCRIL